jgi:hypothetical protein
MDQDNRASCAPITVMQANSIHFDEGAFGWVPALRPTRGDVVEQGKRTECTSDPCQGPSMAPSASGSAEEVHRHPLMRGKVVDPPRNVQASERAARPVVALQDGVVKQDVSSGVPLNR